MKRQHYLVPTLLILICFLTAFTVRMSYRNDLQSRMLNFNYQSNDKLENVLNKSTSHTAAERMQQADLIVKCSVTGTRQVTNEAFYTPVQITEVYKGDKERNKKTITVIEAADIMENDSTNPDDSLILNTGFYIPLQQENEYLLLLKKVSSHNELYNSHYYPVDQSAFSVYRISNAKQTKVIDPEKEKIKWNQLSEFDLFATDKEQIEVYYQWKKQIFEALKI
ncbi:hypothetical protein [Clostridium minihomine]|uniref:hypothetical protein n=1 Tax=Clostridium minihomine TaxID=2045012 RepID=UPI000C77D206|nr:hypothetical protein [Clostridium minihomine]